VPERIRTSDLWIRSPTLYPAELQARRGLKNIAENTGKRKEREGPMGGGMGPFRSLATARDGPPFDHFASRTTSETTETIRSGWL
jgi:hypothetical protein